MDLGQSDWFLLALVGALALLAGAGLGWAICYARLHGRLAVEVARGEMLIFESWLGMNRAGCEWLGLA